MTIKPDLTEAPPPGRCPYSVLHEDSVDTCELDNCVCLLEQGKTCTILAQELEYISAEMRAQQEAEDKARHWLLFASSPQKLTVDYLTKERAGELMAEFKRNFPKVQRLLERAKNDSS